MPPPANPASSATPTVTTSTAPTLPPNLKRKYDEIVEAITPGSTTAKKRQRDCVLVHDLRRETYHSVMLYGPEKTPPDTAASNEVAIPASERKQQEQGIAAFDKLFSVAPEFLEVVKLLYLEASDKPKQWDGLVSMRTHHRHHSLKHKLDYFLPNPRKDVLRPPIPEQESKSDRGLAHPILRYFILPWRDRSKLPPLVINPPRPSPSTPAADDTPNATDADAASTSQQAAFLKRIVENKVKFKSKAFPSCFYEDGMYDSKNLDQGLLRGEVIPRVLRHVWTGPKSGIDGSSDGLPKGCNALAHNIVRVSPEMIGYGACQARTMLATKDWAERDGEYDYNELFTKVVDLFADPNDPWAKETLDWYQNQVFGNAAANIPQAGSDEESDGEEDIMTQRAARRVATSSLSCYSSRFLCFMNFDIVLMVRLSSTTITDFNPTSGPRAASTPFPVLIMLLMIFPTTAR
ncbi:hypothetical protein B0H13DRAFT_2497427 [Mycena leptocephala]|nr:hypothetical protein B0H13DRAFT_2497427 [Mycena leptocephala]